MWFRGLKELLLKLSCEDLRQQARSGTAWVVVESIKHRNRHGLTADWKGAELETLRAELADLGLGGVLEGLDLLEKSML